MMLDMLLAAYCTAIIVLYVAFVCYCRKTNETIAILTGCVDQTVDLYAKLAKRVRVIEEMNTYVRLDSDNTTKETRDKVLEMWERMLDE